jgi:hypothetical protein
MEQVGSLRASFMAFSFPKLSVLFFAFINSELFVYEEVLSDIRMAGIYSDLIISIRLLAT